jgi:hypothetical protein
MARRRSSKGGQNGKAAQKSVRSAMRRAKSGTLKSGPGRRASVKSRKQAIAIGLSEAREGSVQAAPPPLALTLLT